MDGSGSIGSQGRLDPQAENVFSDLRARAGCRPASLWEAQGAEPEGTVPRLRPAPARTSWVQLAAEGRRGANHEGPAGQRRNRENGTGKRGAGSAITFAIVFLERNRSEAAGGAQRRAAHLHVAAHVCLGGRL